MQEMIGKGIYTFSLWIGLGFFCLCTGAFPEININNFPYTTSITFFGIAMSLLIFFKRDKSIKKDDS